MASGRSVARGSRFASQSFCPQTFAILMESLLRGLVLAHRLLGVGTPLGISGHSLFRCECTRRAS
jgi:hypothetical protein